MQNFKRHFYVIKREHSVAVQAKSRQQSLAEVIARNRLSASWS